MLTDAGRYPADAHGSQRRSNRRDHTRRNLR
jgi:hypothetical protein